jgi:hypothetical protein
MSVLTTDLVVYAAANICSDDAGASGGAIDPTRRGSFTQMNQVSTLTYVSDGADVRTVSVTGRVASGAVVTEIITLNGTTAVIGTQTFERIQRVDINTPDASRTMTVSQVSNALAIGSVPPTEVGFCSFFSNSASGVSSVSRYEKCFFINGNDQSSLSTATVTLLADPSSRIALGLESAVNGTGATSNRLTAPSPVTFAGIGVTQSVPGGQLTSNQAIGVWIRQTLLANDAPQRASFSTQLSGTSV